MDAPESPRRWHQEWNVRVVIAIIAAIGFACLGWEVQTVRHRRAMLAQIEAAGGEVVIVAFETPANPFVPPVRIRPADRDYRHYYLSEIRRLFGDGKIGLILFDRRLTAADREAIEAFPEAYVDGIPDSPPPAQPK